MARKRRGRGEGSIYPYKDGYAAAVSQGYDLAGKRLRKTVYGKTKSEVAEKLRKAQGQQVGEIPDRMTVAAFLTMWLNGAGKVAIEKSTLTRYEQTARLQIIPKIGSLYLDKLTVWHVEQMIESLADDGESRNKQNKAANLLQKALRNAVKIKLIPHNVALDVTKPVPEKPEIDFLSEAETETFIRACEGDRLGPLYVLALLSGMREGELFGLAWSDFDFASSSLMVQRMLQELRGKLTLKETKTAKGRRRIDLPRYAIDVMAEHQKRMLAEGHAAAPVFCDSEGGYLRKSNVTRRSFNPLLTKAKLRKVTFHELRHTHATLLLLKGVHPKIVSERLGHASVEITLNTYSHVLPTMQREAADKLQASFGAIGGTMAVKQAAG